jgi:hypothetical protein
MVDIIAEFVDFTEEKNIPEKDNAITTLKLIEKTLRELKQTATSFSVQLQTILQEIDKIENQQLLQERVLKSIHYFGSNLSDKVIKPLHDFIVSLHNKKGVRGYLKKADEVEKSFISKLTQIEKLQFGDTTFYEGATFYNSTDNSISEKLKAKPVKGESNRESLRLFKEGKSVEDIAKERSMAVTTIEGHLATYITSGEIDISSFLNDNELNEIKEIIDSLNTTQLTPIKQKVGDKFSYGQIKMAVAYFTK